ncbi:hypothetical protein Tco_1453343, partial [Tanacetum coccineum]
MGILSRRSIGARYSPKPAPIPVEDLIGATLRAHCSTKYTLLKSVVERQDELLKVRDGEIENLKAQLLLREMEAAETVRLRAQASNFEAAEKSLQDEVKALKERNTSLEKEQDGLDVKVTELETSAMGKDHELTDLNAQITSIKFQNDSLVNQVHQLETYSSRLREKVTVYENCMEQLEKFQDAKLKVVNYKVAKLDTDVAEMACHLEERFYPHLLATISGRRWLLTYGLKLILVKCLNSSKYLTALGAAISRAIEKGMQDEADYNSALQELREVDFSLLAELKSHKDASIEDIMNLLRLESPLADVLGMGDLQLDIELLRVPIHRSEDL